jgi:hypothetical protein
MLFSKSQTKKQEAGNRENRDDFLDLESPRGLISHQPHGSHENREDIKTDTIPTDSDSSKRKRADQKVRKHRLIVVGVLVFACFLLGAMLFCCAGESQSEQSSQMFPCNCTGLPSKEWWTASDGRPRPYIHQPCWMFHPSWFRESIEDLPSNNESSLLWALVDERVGEALNDLQSPSQKKRHIDLSFFSGNILDFFLYNAGVRLGFKFGDPRMGMRVCRVGEGEQKRFWIFNIGHAEMRDRNSCFAYKCSCFDESCSGPEEPEQKSLEDLLKEYRDLEDLLPDDRRSSESIPSVLDFSSAI